MTENRFFVYGRASCPFCVMACDFLAANQKEYIFFDHAGDEDFIEEVKNFYETKTVPVILINDLDVGATTKIGGYTDLLEYFR